jgi:hypothetical protein
MVEGVRIAKERVERLEHTSGAYNRRICSDLVIGADDQGAPGVARRGSDL